MSAKPLKNAGSAFDFTDWLDLWTTWLAAVLLTHRTAWRADKGYQTWKIKDRCDVCAKSKRFPGWPHVNSVGHISAVCGVSPKRLRSILAFCTQLLPYRDFRRRNLTWADLRPVIESWIALAKHNNLPAKVSHTTGFPNRVAGIQAAFTRYHRECTVHQWSSREDLFPSNENFFFELGCIYYTDLQEYMEAGPIPSKEEISQFSTWILENRAWVMEWGSPALDGSDGKPSPWLPEQLADDLHFAHRANELFDDPHGFLNEFENFHFEDIDSDDVSPDTFEAWRARSNEFLTPEARRMVERVGWKYEIRAARREYRKALNNDDPETFQRLALSGLWEDPDEIHAAISFRAYKCIRSLLEYRPLEVVPWEHFTKHSAESAEGLMLFAKALHAKHGESVWHWIDEAVGRRSKDDEDNEAIRNAVEQAKLDVAIGDAPAKRPARRERRGPSSGI